MKNTVFTIALALFFVTTGLGQKRTVLLHESFDGNSIPNDWLVMGEGANNWVVSNTNHTGAQGHLFPKDHERRSRNEHEADDSIR